MKCGRTYSGFRAAAAFLILLLASCQTTVHPDKAVTFFNDVAFRGSPGGHPMSGQALATSGFEKHRLLRWESQIVARISGRYESTHQDHVRRTFETFHRITGQDYVWAEAGGPDVNFDIEFVAKDGFLVNKVEYVPCYAQTSYKDGRITDVEIKISTEYPDAVAHCIPHELAHGFGFAHSNKLPSVINPNDRLTAFSRWDELAMETLYDDRLRSGMSRLEALPIARQIIMEKLGGQG